MNIRSKEEVYGVEGAPRSTGQRFGPRRPESSLSISQRNAGQGKNSPNFHATRPGTRLAIGCENAMASHRPHDYEKDIDLITLLHQKKQLEAAEAYNSPQAIARKRKAVKSARRLSARQLSTSTEYASRSDLAIRSRTTQADGTRLDFDDAMDPMEIEQTTMPEGTTNTAATATATSGERKKRKNRRRMRERNPIATIARIQRQKAAAAGSAEPERAEGEPEGESGAGAGTAEAVAEAETVKAAAKAAEKSTPLSTPQRRSARIKKAKTQRERDEELILSQLQAL